MLLQPQQDPQQYMLINQIDKKLFSASTTQKYATDPTIPKRFMLREHYIRETV